MSARLIPEQVVRGKRLGRHQNHDPRSLRFLVRPAAHAARTVQWQRITPVLDQGDLGSCTGNATVGALGTSPIYETLPSNTRLDEKAAVAIYEAATQLDGFNGTYPPDDTGSDGLSAAKAAHNAGLISGYLHCTSVDATITALQDGPVITGVNWYDSFDDPDSSGRVTIAPDAQVRGGHEFELLGVDLEAKMIHAVNSWGQGWGQAGHFYFSLADLERLLREDGDVTALVPLSKPAPTPTPTPGPSPLTVQLTADEAATVSAWSAKPHVWRKATAAAKVLKAHGL